MTEVCPLCDRRCPSVTDLVCHVDHAHPDSSATTTAETTTTSPPWPASRAEWACEQCTLINDDRAVACSACNATAPAVLRELQQGSPSARAAKRPWPIESSEPDGPSPAAPTAPAGIAATAEVSPQLQFRTTVSALARLVRAANLPVPGSSWALCAATTDHVASEAPDRTYGCGYRNLQMVLTSLREPGGRWPPHLADKLGSAGSLPTIRQLQMWLEQAWAEGFDPQGAAQLGGRVVGTRKWIGATEVAVMLRWLGLRAELVDFPEASGPDQTHPKLLEWAALYFASAVRGGPAADRTPWTQDRSRPPAPNAARLPAVYLQYYGHSRTIVGIETQPVPKRQPSRPAGAALSPAANGAIRLLVLDPAWPAATCFADTLAQVDTAKDGALTAALRRFRVGLPQMRRRQYQLVVVRGVASAAERERSKWLTSLRISADPADADGAD